MDSWAKYTALDKSVSCNSQESETAEADSEESKHYWKLVSDCRLAVRQQRVRPVAADFFNDYLKPVDRENGHTISTTTEPCRQLPNQDRPMVHVGQVLANEEHENRGGSEKPQAFPSQLSISGGTPCSSEDGTAFNSAPSPGLGHRFRKTFGPVASVDENGTIIDIIDKPNH